MQLTHAQRHCFCNCICICVFLFVYFLAPARNARCNCPEHIGIVCVRCRGRHLSPCHNSSCQCSAPWNGNIDYYWLLECYIKEEKLASSSKIILKEWETDRWVIFFLISRNRPVIQTWATHSFWNFRMWCTMRVMTILRMVRTRCSWSCVF